MKAAPPPTQLGYKPYHPIPSLDPACDVEWCSNCGAGNYRCKCTAAPTFSAHGWTYKTGDCLHCGATNSFLPTKTLSTPIVGGIIKYLQGEAPGKGPAVEPKLRQRIADDGEAIREAAKRLNINI